MARHDSDRVNHLLAGISCDVTPAPVGHVAHVLYAPISSDPEVTRHCASVLSDEELQRADRLAADDDRALFLQRRAFRRFLASTVLEMSRPLSQVIFEETGNGRPYLSESPDSWFSFSSCRLGLLGAWSPTHAVGVDLEDHTKDLEATELAHRFFSRAEADVVEELDGLERLRVFYRFWSLKEAALKSIGEGLPFGLDAFEFELGPTLRVVDAPPDHGGPGQFNAHVIDGTDSCAALLVRSLA
jgi:4'-phosphopantetheinyl transferase